MAATNLKEFGDCEGIVEDRVWEYHDDFNVRWKPSNLRYLYGIEYLIKIK